VVQPSKQELRQRILDLIKTQKEEDAFRKSRVILDKLLALPVFMSAKTILFYASFRGEVDTFAPMDKAIELKKRVAVPLVHKETKNIIPMLIRSPKELHRGAYGIPEPAFSAERALDAGELDLVIVPGIAFDQKRNRLGRGAGYYDRFLSNLPATIPTLGLAYDFQVVAAIPGLEPHDRPVTQVLTN
jgi:5-formyltetrahydrofolate cyclo-ligase